MRPHTASLSCAASVARQAAAAGLRFRAGLLVTPGSELIRATMQRDGLTAAFEAAGATVLANACGPCIGQWKVRTATAGARVHVHGACFCSGRM